MDVAFIMDATGSMGGYIENVENSLIEILEKLPEISKEYKVKLRCGFVAYRDHCDGDDILETHNLTEDFNELKKFIGGIKAKGGGDEPEAVADGLNEARKSLDWNEGAYHFVILIGDAPPHKYKKDGQPAPKDKINCDLDVLEEARKLRNMGQTRIYTFGLPRIKGIWEKIADIGGGTYTKMKDTDKILDLLVEAFKDLYEKEIKIDNFLYSEIKKVGAINVMKLAEDASKKFGKEITPEYVESRLGFLGKTVRGMMLFGGGSKKKSSDPTITIIFELLIPQNLRHVIRGSAMNVNDKIIVQRDQIEPLKGDGSINAQLFEFAYLPGGIFEIRNMSGQTIRAGMFTGSYSISSLTPVNDGDTFVERLPILIALPGNVMIGVYKSQ